MAKPVLVRIDDRLLHGQIARSWVGEVDADIIIVANDQVSQNPSQQQLMDIVTPIGSNTYFLSVDETKQNIKNLEIGKRALILVKTPKDAYELLDSSLFIGSVNIGNIQKANGKTKVNENVYLGEDDLLYLKKIRDLGKQLDLRTLAKDEVTSIEDLIN